MKYKIYEFDNYRIHTIKTDKFKNCSIEVIFSNKIDKNKITENNVICDLLMYSSKKYKTKREISMELENLYSSYVRGVVSRLGNSVLTSFITDFLDPKYCDEGTLEEVIKFSSELLLNPNIQDGKFDERSFNIVTNRIKADIESMKENATKYAFRRSLMNMDDNSVTSYHMVGYMDDFEHITTSSMVDTYKELLTRKCDIYVVGNLDMDNVVELIRNYYTFGSTNRDNINLYVDNKLTDSPIDIVENGKYEQSTYIMINNLDGLTKRERDYVIHLYNFILGGGGLTSKLYRYLREENSLCYIVSSMYQKFDQLLMVYAGINKKDKDKAISLTNKAILEMKNGEFSDDDLENAKKNLVSSIKMSEDTLGGIINNYLFRDIDNTDLYDKKIEELNSVTKEEIVKLANKIKLNTVYLLAGEEV